MKSGPSHRRLSPLLHGDHSTCGRAILCGFQAELSIPPRRGLRAGPTAAYQAVVTEKDTIISFTSANANASLAGAPTDIRAVQARGRLRLRRFGPPIVTA